MQFKRSVIAISLLSALALTGCGSDSSSPSTGGNGGTGTELSKRPDIAVPTKGQFIDAQVEGLHYVSGNKKGITGADGGYDIDAANPKVNFYLGGEKGMFIGSISGRHVTTPFEAVGTHERAVNLARLLLTLDNDAKTLIKSGNPVELITLPTDFSAAKEELATANLNEVSTLQALATKLGKGSLITEEQATTHMGESLKGLKRGSDVVLTHWAKGSNWTFVERSARQRIRPMEGAAFENVIHADRMLGDKLFADVSGLTATYFTLTNDNFIMRKGSNDSTISDYFALQYLTCLQKDGQFDVENDTPTCNGEDIQHISPIFSDIDNSVYFQYVFADPTEEQKADETYSWSGVSEMGGAYKCMTEQNCTEQNLTKFEVIKRNDKDEDETKDNWLREVISGSYDPIADVYIQTRSKQYLTNDANESVENGTPDRISESISFIYPVEAVGQDRYVDFKGTWIATESNENCPGVVAVSKFVFDDNGVTLTGQEFNSGCNLSEELNETATYTELAQMDYWWFGTNQAGVSKATLDQLNTTIRWNDIDVEAGETGTNYKINRFSYIPAGKDWDRGTLVRDTLDISGKKTSTITMHKE